MVDLRSDTVTRPTPGMLEAMFRAEVGDDVLRDDPTVRRLEERAAEFLGQETSLFMPSGTMANQTALRAWTEPGQEVIADRWTHLYIYEAGAPAAISGLSVWPIDTADGILSPQQVEAAIRPDNVHLPVTRVVAVENTHNRHGGACYPVGRVAELRDLTRRRNLVLHMDGARICNAAVATGTRPADYGRLCDSVTMCLSKGLGCPVGSMLAGPASFIQRARRIRKMFGGGMRQSGYLAAAGLYALDHHVERLAEDHARARRLAEGLADVAGLDVDPAQVPTNMVYVRFRAGADEAKRVCEAARREGVLFLLPKPDTARLVTHLDVDDSGIDAALAVFRRLLGA